MGAGTWIVGGAAALMLLGGGITRGPDGAVSVDPTLGGKVQIEGAGGAIGTEAGGAVGAAVDGAVGEISPGTAAKITGVAAGGYAAGHVSRYAGQAAVDRLRGLRVPSNDGPSVAPPVTAPQQPRPPSPPPAPADAPTVRLPDDNSSTVARAITGVAAVGGWIAGDRSMPQQRAVEAVDGGRVVAGAAVEGGATAVRDADWSQMHGGAAAGAAGGITVPPWVLAAG